MNPLRRAAVGHVFVDVLDAEVGAPFALADDDAHHLFRVLRARDGDIITVSDGAGRWRLGRVADRAVIADGNVVGEPSPTPATVAVAVPKGDRPEWIVQKLTELGIAHVVFLHAERSVVRWEGERADRHLARLRRVAREAASQSRRVWLPTIEGPLPASSLLSVAVVAEPGGRGLTAADRTVAVGPEGGWTDEERAMARDEVELGDGLLRVETAAVAAGVLLRHLCH